VIKLGIKSAVLLAATLLLASWGCEESHGPSSTGGNTNWLRECSSDAQCDLGVCLCGVCTALCETSASCQAPGEVEARCVDPSMRGIASACAEDDERTRSVCLASCEDTSDCDRGQRCLQGACVSTSGEVLTALMQADGPCDLTGSCDDGLVCDPGGTCRAPTPDELDLVEPPEPVDGGMPVAPSMPGDAGVPDGGCTDPEGCDGLAGTVLAEVGDAEPFALTATHVYLYTRESRDSLNNPQGDGLVTRLPREGGDIETLVDDASGFSQPMLVGEHLLYGKGTAVWRMPRDGGEATQLATVERGGWGSDGAHLYYAGGAAELMRAPIADPGSGTAIMPLDERHFFSEVLHDSDELYLVSGGLLWSIPKLGGEERVLRDSILIDYIAIDQSNVFVIVNDALVESIAKDGTTTRSLTEPREDRARLRQHRDHVYFIRYEPSEWQQLWRAPKEPGEGEMLVEVGEAQNGTRGFVVGDAGLFWVSGGMLRHLELPGLDDVAAPQGEPGAPCFDDGLCNGDATCIDAICE
jgi:hypothetical protein